MVILEYWPHADRGSLDYLESLGYRCFDANLYCRVNRPYYQQRLKGSEYNVANVVALPPWAESAYEGVALRKLVDLPVAAGSLRSPDCALPEAGRYVLQVDLDGPHDEPIAIVVVAHNQILVETGGPCTCAGLVDNAVWSLTWSDPPRCASKSGGNRSQRLASFSGRCLSPPSPASGGPAPTTAGRSLRPPKQLERIAPRPPQKAVTVQVAMKSAAG